LGDPYLAAACAHCQSHRHHFFFVAPVRRLPRKMPRRHG
jgi:hypothetical protein